MTDVPVDQWLHWREIEAKQLAHPVPKRKGEGDGYEFIDGELELAKDIGTAAAVQAGKALAAFDAIVTDERVAELVTTTKGLEDKLARDLEKLDPIMRETWTSSLEKKVASTIGSMTERGARRAGAFRRLANLATRGTIEEGMVASTKYYTNTYFNRVVLPSMVGDIERKLATGEGFDEKFFRTLRDSMDRRLKSVPHWKLVGNQAASRAYHYGLARGGMLDGYTGYTLKATVDDRTTDVCLSLNGKSFWLADAVERVERVATMLPSRIKQDAPWLTLPDVEGKDTAELQKSDILVPPFHGNCRTTMVLNR